MKFVTKLFMIMILPLLSLFALDLGDSLRVNGYGNLYIVTNDDAKEQDREKYMNTSGGIQARYLVNDKISTTAQLYFYENENNIRNDSFEVDAKWLYMDYYFGNDITLRAGLFQFPIFKSAEMGTIGYSLTWSETPLSSYGANGYDDFLGIEMLKKYFYKDYEFLIQLSYGTSENDLPTNKDSDTVNGKTNSLIGITLKTTYDWFSLNIGYLQATSKIKDMVMDLEGSTSSQEVDFYMYALEGEVYFADFTGKAGYINVKLSDIFPDELKYYTSLEYNYKDFTPYVYYSREHFAFDGSMNKPDILSEINMQRYSIGTRYDFNQNVAFKVSYQKKIKTENFSFREETRYENIYKATINVIF